MSPVIALASGQDVRGGGAGAERGRSPELRAQESELRKAEAAETAARVPQEDLAERASSGICLGVPSSSVLNPEPCAWRERPLSVRRRLPGELDNSKS